MRDDFSKATKDKLAKRVGFHCSLCDTPTSGPSEDNNGVTMIGEAAHICAASPGGPRYDANMTSDKRSSIDNGIWLCANCARKIDRDATKYTVDSLKTLKEQAEQRATGRLSIDKNQASSLPDDVKNQIIANLKRMIDGGKSLKDNYAQCYPATNETDDTNIYSICVYIYNAFVCLLNEESQNHMQFKKAGLDTYIFEIRAMFPNFYDAQNDWTGIPLITTTYDFTRFFDSDEGVHFINKCEELIACIERM